MSYYTKYVDKVKLKDTWEIVTRGLKWSELTQSQKNLFGKGMSTFNQQKVFQEWKNGLSKSDKNKAQDLQDDYLSKYDIKNWSNVSDKDREKFFDNKKSNYIDWYNENYAERDRNQEIIAANTQSKQNPLQIAVPKNVVENAFTTPAPTTGLEKAQSIDKAINQENPGPLAPALLELGKIQDSGNPVTADDVNKLKDLDGGENAIAAIPNIDDLSISKDAKQSILDALGIQDMSFKDYIKQSANSPVITNEEGDTIFNFLPEQKGFFDRKLDAAGLDAAYGEYSASQLLKYYNDGDLKIGKNALNDIKKRADEEEGSVEIGGYGRIGEGRFTDRPAADPKNDTGVLYKTYNTGSGDDKFLKIGNLRGHRYEGSPYADIKIVDYDASIENYDPSKEGTSTSNFVESYGKKSGKIKFTKYKPQRQEYTADTFRTEAQRKDYAMRGISKGGRITKYKQDGVYKNIETNADGNLKRLTLDDNGNYKATTSKYPSAVRSNSFSDLLESKTGLKIGGSATRDQRLASIKSQLSI